MKFLLIFSYSILSLSLFSQVPGEWTWMSGSNTSGNAVYGSMGQSSPDVTPGGGNLYEGRTWVDNDGNFWFYGGYNMFVDLELNNMWKYDVSTNEWTWMKGSGSSGGMASYGTQGIFSNSNNPPASGISTSISWTGLDGTLWFLSVTEYNASMWKYDISLNQWAWMHGNIPSSDGTLGVASPLNNPGFFMECPISWTDDSGNLWFLDGESGSVMWKYDITINQWTRMLGETQGDYLATNFGTKGVFSSSNNPGSRWTYQHWKSDDGLFYMFGNMKLNPDSISWFGKSDMWAFDPSINQWAWVGGRQNTISSFSFSGLGEFSSINVPLGRGEEINNWKDECNRFWGYDSDKGFLWCYDPVIDQFAWMDGDLTENSIQYGVQGVSSPLNSPSSNNSFSSTYGLIGTPHWTDKNGHFWMMQSYTDMNGNNISSAMWRYIPPLSSSTSANINFTAEPNFICENKVVSFVPNVQSQYGTYIWDFGDGSNSTELTPNHIYSLAGNYQVNLIVVDTVGCNINDTAQLDIIVGGFSPSVIQPPVVCKDIPQQLEAYGGGSYVWSPSDYLNNSSIANPVATVNENTLFLVIITDSCGVDTLSVQLNVNLYCEEMVIEAPNVFTPNIDGENDLYFIKTENVQKIHLVIINRWGEVMFDETGESPKWNGKNQNGKEAVDGVYYFTYFADGYNGKTAEGYGFLQLIGNH